MSGRGLVPPERAPRAHTPVEARLERILSKDLDRLSPIPLYHQLAQNLRRAILDGSLAPGTTLGNEVVLAGAIGVGRPTLRQAFQELVDVGLLVRRRGVGTQVVRSHPAPGWTPAATSTGPVASPPVLHGLWDEMQSQGRTLTADVLEHTCAAAGAELADVFGVDAAEVITTVRRLRVLDGVPLALTLTRTPQRLAPDPEHLRRGGLLDHLRRRGVALRVAQQQVSARHATPEEAQLLGEDVCVDHVVVLVVDRTVFDDAGVVATTSESVYLASGYSLRSTLVNR